MLGGGGAGGVMYGGWGFEWLKMMERMGWINEQMIVGAGGGGVEGAGGVVYGGWGCE